METAVIKVIGGKASVTLPSEITLELDGIYPDTEPYEFGLTDEHIVADINIPQVLVAYSTYAEKKLSINGLPLNKVGDHFTMQLGEVKVEKQGEVMEALLHTYILEEGDLADLVMNFK